MKRILVVDDDDATVDAIAELLRDTGYDACTATTGGQALANLRHSRPDLLILDMFMPDVDGWQVLDTIASDSQLARMPKVAMTAWPLPIELPPGVTLLRKPFAWDALARLIRNALRPTLPRLPRDLESNRSVLLAAH
jgi:CheY-like chemotaxis protein